MDPFFITHRRFFSGSMTSTTPSRQIRWMLCLLFCSIAVVLVLPSIALASPAHAEYMSSDPAANAMLTKAPTTITIHFSEQVNPMGSDILVSDVDGKSVSTAAGQVDRSDLKTMTVTMKSDQSEVYVVDWHTVSAVEGHHDAGSFRFFVNISSMLKGMVGSPSMSGSSTPSTGAMSSGSSSSSSSGVPVGITVLIGVLGLVIGGVAVFAFVRRSGSSPNAGG